MLIYSSRVVVVCSIFLSHLQVSRIVLFPFRQVRLFLQSAVVYQFLVLLFQGLKNMLP